ncbi:MAG: FAD-dependent oxidoreductase [Gammaproteobacteria bacterium]|nr:FAD-dependent oxidoreductase [Gammaproteobacteria bacterium]
MNKKIAVIGSGIAGMASAWLLNKHYQVTLIDKNAYIGGHTNTVSVTDVETGKHLAVDTGFIVYNEPNYPNLVGLFNALGVQSRPTSMSFSASIFNTGLEYAGSDLNTLFAQRRNLFSPRFLKLIYDILKFNRVAKALINDTTLSSELTLGEFLQMHNIGKAMQNDYLLPMAAAIWSCPPSQMAAFPAKSFAQFFDNHGLLNVKDRPQWRTVNGGSQAYVAKLLDSFSGQIITNNAVVKVDRTADQVTLTLADRQQLEFDDVIIATHADEALALLAQATNDEQRYLSAFRYQQNDTYLHTDERLMPKLKAVWSCWNYIADNSDDMTPAVSVSYWMNALQGLDTASDFFVSLNPIVAINPAKVVKQIQYMHPVFDNAAIAAQKQLECLQGKQHTWYAGSYFGYGFHEDALSSAVSVAKAFGIQIPWQEGLYE